MMPSEWIANRNDRVVWYCHCPCRPAYAWKGRYLAERGLAGKAVLSVAVAAFDAVEQRIVPRIARICTNSQFTAQGINTFLGRNDAQVIYPGVDVQDFRCEDYGKFFFYPSRIVPEKRMEFAIAAFRKASLKGWKLVLGGFVPDLQSSRSYLARLRQLAGNSDVRILTEMSEKRLKSLYANCSAILFPPMMEDWGLVPIEGMASSKPVIAINEGGPRESVEDGKTGFLVNSEDGMAEKMRFFAEHPAECEKMGKAGRKRVEKNFTWKIFLGGLEKAFRETARSSS